MQAIFFDLDGTLLRLPDFGELLAGTFREVRGETRDEWLETYSEAFLDAFGNHEPEPYRRGFEAVAGTVESDAEVLAETLQRREVEFSEPPEGAVSDLEALAEQYRLGVLTNGVPEVQRAKLDASGLARFFDTVVVSYEVGAHKPDPTPFRAAEKRLPADAYAMVGDSDDDIEGAEQAGWTAHRYDGSGFGDLPEAFDW